MHSAPTSYRSNVSLTIGPRMAPSQVKGATDGGNGRRGPDTHRASSLDGAGLGEAMGSCAIVSEGFRSISRRRTPICSRKAAPARVGRGCTNLHRIIVFAMFLVSFVCHCGRVSGPTFCSCEVWRAHNVTWLTAYRRRWHAEEVARLRRDVASLHLSPAAREKIHQWRPQRLRRAQQRHPAESGATLLNRDSRPRRSHRRIWPHEEKKRWLRNHLRWWPQALGA